MKNSNESSSYSEEEELPIQVYMMFYYIPKQRISLCNNRALLSDVNLNLVKEAPISFDLQPYTNRCSFASTKYFLKDDNLLDSPQLYRVFQLGGAYYAQILDYIAKITVKDGLQQNFDNLDEGIQITPLLRFLENEIETPELSYARVAKLSEEELLYTADGILWKYHVGTDLKEQLVLKEKDGGRHDYLVFSYNGIVAVFDTNTNYFYELQRDRDTYELHFLFETEGQQLIFQNRYIILSDGDQPRPLIEIIDIPEQKLYSSRQNWFQDNFWAWLKVVKNEIEVDEEVQSIINRLRNGETVDFKPEEQQSENE